MEQERRRSPRYPFAGSIEMREGASEDKRTARVMGLMFRETKPYYLMVLRKWLLAAMMGKKGPRS